MSRTRRSLGARGEVLAMQALQERGLEIVARNWRCAIGELDLVARDGDWLVFVEVRTRRGRRFGTPEESITPRKQQRLIELGETFVQEQAWPGSWRIDVVAVHLGEDGRLLHINHVPYAVEGG